MVVKFANIQFEQNDVGIISYTGILYFLVFAPFGCSHAFDKESDSPIQKYHEYVGALSKKSHEDILQEYWAESFVSESLPLLLDDSENAKFERNAVIFSINFPQDMTSMVFQKENVNDRSACVLVAGVSEENTPLIFNVAYTMENGRWLIKKVHGAFLGASDPYPSQPDCFPAASRNITK